MAFQNCPLLTCIDWDPSVARSIQQGALPTNTACPPSKAPTSAPTAPTAVPTVSPSSKAPTLAPSYLAGSPTTNPSIAPTASPTANMVTCTQNGGNGCCNLCGISPCTMTFSSAVTYIGNYDYYQL